MNNLLEFLDEDVDKQFSKHGLEKIIEVLKNFSIYEYRVISDQLIFKFCDYEYIIINDEDKYNIEFGHKSTLPNSLEKLIERLPGILKYGRNIKEEKIPWFNQSYKYPEPIQISASYEIDVKDIVTGCPGTEWEPDPGWDRDGEIKIYGQKPIKPIIYAPYIPLVVHKHND